MHKCFVAILLMMALNKIGHFVGVHCNVYLLFEFSFHVLQHYFREVK